MVNKLFSEFADLEQVEAIALGGSRAGECYDEKSDYDVYVYITSPISADIWRSAINIGSTKITVCVKEQY